MVAEFAVLNGIKTESYNVSCAPESIDFTRAY